MNTPTRNVAPGGRVAVTGANGFVGRALLVRLARDFKQVVAVTRGAWTEAPSDVMKVAGLDLDIGTVPDGAFTGCDVVVHLAARVHVMDENAPDPDAAFGRANVAGSLAVAREAAAAGVRRLVYVSSVKAHGEASLPGRPIRSDDPLRPLDAYGRSKRDAERQLVSFAAANALELVIVRPPLVYGPGAVGNFAALARAVCAGVPLPFASLTESRRSMVGVDNLVDLLAVVSRHRTAAGEAFLVSDGVDVTVAELVEMIGNAVGRRARVLGVPPNLLRAALLLTGCSKIAQRLMDPLQVDMEPTRRLLEWNPPVALQDGIRNALSLDAMRNEAR